MSDFIQDIQFTDQPTGGITAKKLNIAWRDGQVSTNFVARQPPVGGVASGDYLLLLKADGSYAKVPATAIGGGGGGTGTGDMLKAVYDTNNNGVVDTADSLAYSKLTGVPANFTPALHASTHLSAGSDPIAIATSVLAGLCPAVDNTTIQVVASKLSCVALAWSAITGKPSTFPPDSTAMLKSVYDTNSDNIVDHAALSDAVPWTGITGKPSTFPPDSTAMLKSVYDTDNNGKVDTCDSLPYSSLTGTPAIPAPASTTPIMDGPGAVGTGTTYARNDHVHPTDTSRAPLASPTFTGVPAGPTAAAGTSTTQLATTAFVAAAAPVPAPNDANKFLQGTGTTNGTWGYLPVATETNAGITIPAVGSTVVVPIISFAYFVPLVGQTVFIMDTVGGGRCMMGEIIVVSSGTSITVINRGYPGTTAAGLTIASKAWLSVIGPGFATATQPGFVPTPPNNTTTFLRGDATFAPVPGGTVVDPGIWTAFSYATGWSETSTARFRVQTVGSILTLFSEGIIAYASGAASLAFTLPTGAWPSVTRGCALAGYDSSGDTQLFEATIATGGAVNIVPMVRQNFSWPSATNGNVYLDNLSFAL